MKKGLLVIVLLFALVLSACNVPLGTPAAPTSAPLPQGSATADVATPEATATNQPSATGAPATATTEPTKESSAPVVNPVPVQNTVAAPQPTAWPSGEAFDQALGAAIEARDFDALRGMMKPRFSFAYYPTQLLEFAAEEAMQRMASTILADGAQPAVIWGADTVALLEGKDPLEEWGPVADPVRAMYVTGLGSDTTQEALFVIARDGNGQRYFHGVLLPEGGYFHSTAPDPDAVVETSVKRVEALEQLNVRSGPGTNYAVEGQMRPGEIGTVTGRSADGKWWRIACTQDSSGNCWISADEELSQPVG